MEEQNMTPYETHAAHPFFGFTQALVDYEIRPERTISFLSDVDLTEVETIRASVGDRRKPSYTAFVAKAVALALRDFPYANRRLYRRRWLPFSGWRLQQFTSCDVAVACERDLPGIEVAAFIDILRDADRRSLTEMTNWLHALATSDASSNKQWREYFWIITHLPHWLALFLIRLPCFFPKMWARYRGGAVLISSPAKYGVDGVVGSWTAPLGVSFGLVKERPVVRNGRIVACPTFTFLLNWDRSIMAGAQAARFFKRIVDILENAETEMKENLPEDAAERKWNPSRAERNPAVLSRTV
ncbi:MAG: 2-oxo acid dehydrogenase subunit E2 [Planctomycetota bacterium]